MAKDYFVRDMGQYVVGLDGRTIADVLELLSEEKNFTTFPRRAEALGIMGVALRSSASDLEAMFYYNQVEHKIHYFAKSYFDPTRLKQIELQTDLPDAQMLALSKVFPQPSKSRKK